MRKISKDAFVMIGHCPRNKGIYGITVDKIAKRQYCTVWAFPLNRERAKHEGFGETSVNGSITNDAEYPGCPYCEAKDMIICSCGAVICNNGQHHVTCPNCGNSGEVTYASSFNLRGGSL